MSLLLILFATRGSMFLTCPFVCICVYRYMCAWVCVCLGRGVFSDLSLTSRGTTCRETQNHRYGGNRKMVARKSNETIYGHRFHTPQFSCSMYSSRHLIGCRQRSAWLWLVRLIITRTVRRLAIATFAVATPSELFYWHVRYLHICLLCCVWGGSVAEWLACWAQAQKGLGSNRSRDAVG